MRMSWLFLKKRCGNCYVCLGEEWDESLLQFYQDKQVAKTANDKPVSRMAYIAGLTACVLI